jgi:protein ImuB
MAKVKSAVRLIALDARALAQGLRPMLTLADARAMYPGLAVYEADPAGDLACRDAILDWCRRFTPLAAPDDETGIMLDISGCAHLFGGETALMADMETRLAAQGFAATVAIADTPGAAWALARYGKGRRHIAPQLAPEALAKIFAPLPLAALRLDARGIAQLGQAGLRRIGDLLIRPRAPIAARFGRDIYHRLDLLLGRAKDPISPRFAAPPFVAERRFAEGIARREEIEATIRALADDLCGLLARHGEGARQLDVALYRVDGIVKHLSAGTSRPLRDPRVMARLFHERIEAAGEDGLDTGYGFDLVRLAALSAEPLDALQPGWIETAEGGADLAELIDRLGARFGLARVTRLTIADSHQPEAPAVVTAETPHKVRAKSVAQTKPATGDGDAMPERPIRLFQRPEPIETIAAVPDGPPLRFNWRRVTHHVAAIEGPERIGPDWWRQGRDKGASDLATRDYFRAEDTEGRRFWLYREGLYRETPEPRWFLHGLFG